MKARALNDELLIKASSGGNTEAFEVLVRKYQSYICAVTLSATGSIDKSEELAQEVFILAWQKLAQLKNHAKFKSWLYTIAKNRIKKFYRHQQHDPIAHAITLEDAGAVKDNGNSPAETVLSQEQRDFIWDTLSRIPVHYREPLVLFYREDKSVKQVADLLELSEDTVKQRLSRARQMIKTNLASMLEQTLAETRPKETFSAGVVGLIAAGGTLSKTAAGGAAQSGTHFISTFLQSTAAKITAATAAAILIGTGAVTYVASQANQPPPEPVVRMLPLEMQDGLVLYLSFDVIEESDTQTIITDESLFGNHGRLTGGKIVKGRLGRALRCRAKNKSDGVIIKVHDSLDLDTVTIAAWIKTDTIDNQWGRILDKGWRTAYNLCIGGDYEGQNWYRNRVSFECAERSSTSKVPVVDSRWHFIAATYDGQTSSLYIDGKPDVRIEQKERTPMQHNDTDIHIAGLAVPEALPHNEAFYDGLIDEIRLYNRILSEKEIQILYHYQPF